MSMRMLKLLPLVGLLALGACKDEKKAEKSGDAASPTATTTAPASPTVAQSPGEKTGTNSVLGVSPSTADFVTQAAISDMFEIQTSQLALQQSDEPTKAFAKQMIADHEKTSGEMKGMVQGGKVQATLPTALDSTHQGKLDKLKGLKGNDFTKHYHSDQVKAHKDAVDLFQRYAKGGDNSDLKAWAAKTQPALEHHLKMAQDLDK
jgi:putative membrane protein